MAVRTCGNVELAMRYGAVLFRLFWKQTCHTTGAGYPCLLVLRRALRLSVLVSYEFCFMNCRVMLNLLTTIQLCCYFLDIALIAG